MKTAHRINLSNTKPFITMDGSEIREILAHRNSCVRNQSLAEARIKPGKATTRHYHKQAEEIYYIVEGTGLMDLGGKCFAVKPGDAIGILPGTPHQIKNTGKRDFIVLCCCAPAYEHSETILLTPCGPRRTTGS